MKDRLSWWIHGRDRQSLEQAIAVIKHVEVDLDELRRWVRGEGPTAAFAFAEIADQLKKARRRS